MEYGLAIIINYLDRPVDRIYSFSNMSNELCRIYAYIPAHPNRLFLVFPDPLMQRRLCTNIWTDYDSSGIVSIALNCCASEYVNQNQNRNRG